MTTTKSKKKRRSPIETPVLLGSKKNGSIAQAADDIAAQMKPPMEVRWMSIDQIRPYGKNPRKNAAAVPKVRESLKVFGWRQPIVTDAAGVIIAGHTRWLAAKDLGMDRVPVHIAADLTEEEARAYRIADNRTADEATWDLELLQGELVDLKADGWALEGLGFESEELERILHGEGGLKPGADPDAIPTPPKKPTTKPGDLIQLGQHRLLCGDSTRPADLEKLFAGAVPETILTDPPYCSGGFQESGRAKGSIGTERKGGVKPKISNDTLSTRGYRQLLKAAVFGADAPTVYVFLDWRMWANAFDTAEESGYGVRQMIVWDKGNPGMGRGWRSQHELILFGTRGVVDFDNHKAIGNVRSPKRSGNKHHPTEKPVELLTDILGVMDMARTVYDPFAGSGSTLIAAEMLGRKCYAMELMPAFCDTIVLRWEQATGGKAVRP